MDAGDWECSHGPSIRGRREGCEIIQERTFANIQVREEGRASHGPGRWIHVLRSFLLMGTNFMV